MTPATTSTTGAERSDLTRIARAGFAVMALGVLVMGGWLIAAPLSGAVIAQGFVKVDMNRKVVQHQEGGIVKQLLVRDGERVRAGQVLLVIEDVKLDATFDLLRTQHDGERAKAARLEAERAILPEVKFPAELVARKGEAKVADLLQRETTLFRARREALDTQIALLRKQIQQTTVEARALSDQIAAEERALKLQKDELKVNEALLQQGFVQKTRLMQLERSVAEYEARWGEHRAELSKTQQRASELELRVLAQRNTYVQSAADELKELSTRLFDLEERLRPSKDAAERQRISSPIAGEVVGLRVFSHGGVVGPREVLMEIVPEDKTLIVEARIRPEDINHVRAGSEAEIRLTAYKQRTTPLVAGKVNYVAADRMVDPQNNAPYYTAHIDVTAQALADAGNLRMQAGMPAEVYIRTDSRTALDYLLAPVTAYLRRGMREPL
ncbi:MAG TPA: HlyD family type I secretion periplasmic adaptor subunit [Burkholderiales bacterium]|nr:HlyD family type I secretion periplasmic adaptor subunit [Burkholderiales bacterium]